MMGDLSTVRAGRGRSGGRAGREEGALYSLARGVNKQPSKKPGDARLADLC